MIFQWLAYSVPWWVWAIIALIAAGIIYRLFGWRWALAILAVLGSGAALQRSRQQGWKDKAEADEKAADKMVAEADKARAEAAKNAADPKKLRDDDGFRRN